MRKKLILLFILFFVIQLPIVFYFNVFPADENVYYAMTREAANGHILYKEIFLGHPPLQIWIYTFLAKLFGFHIWVFKLFTLLVSIGNAFFVYLISKERYGEKTGFASTFIFLTSYNLIVFGSFAFGLEISVFFFLASLYMLNKKNFLSGFFFALCIMARLHLAILVVILFLYSKDRIRFMLGVSFLLVYYILLFLFVPESIGQIIGYHIVKPYLFTGWIAYFRANIHLFILFFFSFKQIKDIMLVFIGVAYCLFMLLMKSIFEYYFLIITVILCIEAGNCLLNSKYKRILRFAVGFWVFILIFMAAPFLVSETQGYNKMIGYINELPNKDFVGQSAITALLALKTGRNIHLNQIDTNFQRMQVYNYSNALVIYEGNIFKGNDFNCNLLNTLMVKDKSYQIWDC